MNAIEAIHNRRSIRAFLPDAIENEKLTTILESASRAPSWANTQPWEVFVATGDTLDKIKEEYLRNYSEGMSGTPDMPMPAELTEATKSRMIELHSGIERDCGEAAKRIGEFHKTLYNAPAVVVVCIDKMLSEWSIYDAGAYVQTLMLAATELGLGSIPAVSLVSFPDILRRELLIPENLKIIIGVAIGYADTGNEINNFISDRRPFSDFHVDVMHHKRMCLKL